VPKRQPKPDLITPDEVMDSPALRGFDTFLRYRPAEAKSATAGHSGSPMGDLPIGIPIIRPPQKIRRAVKVQDAHSIGEQALYQALWNAAIPETADSRLIRIGYGGMQSLCGLDKSNCKDNILSLIKKLAIEVISGFDIRRNEGNTYRVLSYGAILKRRKAAGLEWVIRSRGVQFVEQPPIGEKPMGDYRSPMGDSPIAPGGNSPGGAVGETPTGPMGKTPIAFRKEIKLEEAEPSSPVVWKALRQHSEVVDDEGVRRLVASCRALAPDCTEEEIAYFIRAKAEQARAGRAVRNLIGFLQTAVPRCFEGSAFREFRTEQDQKRKSEQQQRLAAEAETARMLAEQKAVLADPNATEEDRRFARRILGIPEPGEGRPDG